MSKSEVVTLTERQLNALKLLNETNKRMNGRALSRELEITSAELKKLHQDRLVSIELIKKNRKNLRYFTISPRGIDCVTGKLGHRIVDIDEISSADRGAAFVAQVGELSNIELRILERVSEAKRTLLASQLLFQLKLNNKWKRGQSQIPNDYQHLFDLEEKNLVEIQNKENYDKEGSLSVRITKNGRRYLSNL
ncbi:MAG: hypothetical protein ACFFC7_07370 [Candidatus Hermodarchaeota archaeon]